MTYCRNCAYWISPEPGGVEDRIGQCRRYPPTVISDVSTTGDWDSDRTTIETSPVSLWPETRDKDWCGEWRSIEAATKAQIAGSV